MKHLQKLFKARLQACIERRQTAPGWSRQDLISIQLDSRRPTLGAVRRNTGAYGK